MPGAEYPPFTASVTVFKDDTYSNYIEVEGGVPPYSYQWYRTRSNVDNKVGTDSNVITVTGFLEANVGVYWCRVTDAAGTVVDSKRLIVAVDTYISGNIVTAATWAVGKAALLSMTLSGSVGTETPVVTWYKDDVQIHQTKGKTGYLTLNVASPTASSGGVYRFEVNTHAGRMLKSGNCTVTIASAMTFNPDLPANLPVTPGTNSTLTVGVTGGYGSKTYAWTRDGAAIGSNKTTYGPTVLAAGTYACKVTDGLGQVANSTNCVVSPLVLTTDLPATTLIQPAGSPTAKLTVAVSGGVTPYRYAWTRNGVDMDVNLPYVSSPVGLGDGTFICKVTDAIGQSVTSTACVLTNDYVRFTTNLPATVTGGLPYTLSVSFTGGVPPYTLTWSDQDGYTIDAVTSTGTDTTRTVVLTDQNTVGLTAVSCRVADSKGSGAVSVTAALS